MYVKKSDFEVWMSRNYEQTVCYTGTYEGDFRVRVREPPSHDHCFQDVGVTSSACSSRNSGVFAGNKRIVSDSDDEDACPTCYTRDGMRTSFPPGISAMDI